jgi:lipoprotein-anchoring transpeptidase ErfK/SrfK
MTEKECPNSATAPVGSRVSRRFFLAAAPLALAGCVASERTRELGLLLPGSDPGYAAMYGPLPDERFPIPATDISRLSRSYLRRQVYYDTPHRAGTIVVDAADKYLYLVQADGMAMRYGIGVGREGFAWSGAATVRRKAAWPTWTPPAEMVRRDPKAAPWAAGMPPGLDNPLGARALYLYQGDRDTLYRIHGTNEPWTIGTSASSGCIRLINQDIIDLYNRVPIGTQVAVLPPPPGFFDEGGGASRIADQIVSLM